MTFLSDEYFMWFFFRTLNSAIKQNQWSHTYRNIFKKIRWALNVKFHMQPTSAVKNIANTKNDSILLNNSTSLLIQVISALEFSYHTKWIKSGVLRTRLFLATDFSFLCLLWNFFFYFHGNYCSQNGDLLNNK